MYLRDEHVVGSLRVIADHLHTNLNLVDVRAITGKRLI